MKTPEIISFHPGRQHNLEQAYQISKRFADYKHITSFYFDKKSVERWKNVSAKISHSLKKRSAEVEGGFVDVHPVPEIKLLCKRGLRYTIGFPDYVKRNEAFQQWMVQKYAPPKVCIGFDTSSWVVFEKWKNKSFLILDLSIAIPQYKLALAKENNFDQQFIANQTKGDEVLYDIYEKELNLADLILCGSDFVKNSCLSLGVDPGKLKVLPYGSDLKRFNNPKIQPYSDTIKVVFIGSVIYRKGADVVFKAWEKIKRKYKNVELHFFGGVQIEKPADAERMFFHGFVHQDTLIKELQSAHISILPTFFEGSSLAIYQSMAMGLATITTPNAGSIIEDKETGLLINYGSVEELTESMECLIKDEKLRMQLAKNAQEAIKSFTWDNYGKKINSLIEQVVKPVSVG